MKVTVQVELEYTSHWADDAKIFVANIPAIGVKTQASEANLERAVESAARMWLQLCLDRGTILAWNQRETAPAPVSGEELK